MAAKVAVYTIAKNEAKHVKRWLDTTEGADLRLIADTGSEDETWDLLQQEVENAKAGRRSPLVVHQIHVRPWRFDDSRNAALALLPADIDVCISLDMDELLTPGFINQVRRGWTKETTRGWHDLDTGNVWVMNRIHSRFGFRWVSPIHEVVTPCDDRKQVSKVFKGGIKHAPDSQKSRGQYLPMLERAVKERPEDGRMWSYLVREYSFYQKWAELLDAAGETLKRPGAPNELGYVCRLAAQATFHQSGENGEAVRVWLDKAIENAPEEPESHYALAEYHYHRNEWKACLEAAETALGLPSQRHHISDPSIHQWRAHDLISVSAWNLGDHKRALDSAIKAANGNPTDTRLAQNLAFLMEHAGKS